MKPTLSLPKALDHLELLPYQSAFAANPSRFKIGLWARQTGKDHTAAAEAVIDCLNNPGTDWIILAAGERQARESLSKAKDWADILKFRIAEYIESPSNLPFDDDVGEHFRPVPVSSYRATEIRWSNGSRLFALPANPQTIRGYSANVILTEFAFHENPNVIWRAIYPSISNPLRGGVKKLRIISTPNGLTNKFADLWLNAPGVDSSHNHNHNRNPNPSSVGALASMPDEKCPTAQAVRSTCRSDFILNAQWNSPETCPFPLSPPVNAAAYFKSKVTIHDAIASGLPLNAAELQAGLNDPDAWSQEYLCEFMDSSCVMFPYDLIAPCESSEATESSLTHNHTPGGPLFAGIDFGRKHHLTVCWILEALPVPPGFTSTFANRTSNLFVTREVLTLKNTSTPDQLEILRPRLQRCRKICLDYTGAGIGLGDYLSREFTPHSEIRNPQSRLELCQFTTALKSELFPRLPAAFEQRLLRIPISREIREDLHAIQRTVTQSGQIAYRAPHSADGHSADGHSARTTALALALRAATSAPVSQGATIVRVPPGRGRGLVWNRRGPSTPYRRRYCL